MSDLAFFKALQPVPLSVVALVGEAPLPADADPIYQIEGAASPERAGRRDVTVLRDAEDLEVLEATRAGACFVSPHHRHLIPPHVVALVTTDPARAFWRVAALLHPDSVRPAAIFNLVGIAATAIVHAEARLEVGVTIDDGAIVGPRVEIGTGTLIGANTTLGVGVRIGRGCAIDSQVSINHALIGDRVVVHSGARIGHGVAEPDISARAPVPRLGRVIIQNDVEIGANATIARGGARDTVIGEGSRVANLAVIEADVVIARANNCSA